MIGREKKLWMQYHSYFILVFLILSSINAQDKISQVEIKWWNFSKNIFEENIITESVKMA